MTRDTATRKADTLAMWAAPHVDVWVASASAAGEAHLVPLSLAWVDERLVVALRPDSPTGRNIADSGRARLAVGHTRDVTLADVLLERSVPVELSGALGDAYAEQADWDPRTVPGYVYLVLRPDRVRAWREVDENVDSPTIMRDGVWLA